MKPQQKGEDRHCKFMLVENGTPLTRRIHELIVQDAVGTIHRIDGDRLPSSITAVTGVCQTEHHTLQVLISPRKLRSLPGPSHAPAGWPTRRDLLHVALGFAGLQLLRATVFGVDAFVGTLFDAFLSAFQR